MIVWLLVAAAAIASGELEVRSHSGGAEIYVDSKPVGSVPLDRPLVLSAGQHTLKVTKRGYADFLDVVTVHAHKRQVVDVDLLPVVGVLRLYATVPGARVFVDGKFVGEVDGPVEAELPAGRRSIRVEKGGFQDWLGSVDSVPGKVVEVRAQMSELPVGSTPFRPAPDAPAKWYDHWYVWTGGALAVAAITIAIILPFALSNPSTCQDLHADYCFTDPRH
jgi:PEGA domain